MSKIQKAIQQMSVEEMQQRLAEYMAADKAWAAKPVAIEVRHRDVKDISGSNIYDVIVVKDDDTEEVIKFNDRYSKLIYIYTLLHPRGYQRRSLDNKNKDYQERFYRLWEKLSKEFSGYGDRLAFELLNEVTRKEYCDEWNRISCECIKRIRAILPDVKILVGGYYNNSIVALKDLAAPYDENIVYNFHCYDPLVFTHQGAGWVDRMAHDFRMSVDVTYRELAAASDELQPGSGSAFSSFDPDAKLGSDYFDKCFEEAVRVAEERNVPLYCGEYGVIENASPEDTLKWYEMISDSFNRFSIGRAAWSFREMNFGLTSDDLKEVREKLIKLL